jgi:signal transduction histidine kinase/Tfp pilus assembly protein PilF
VRNRNLILFITALLIGSSFITSTAQSNKEIDSLETAIAQGIADTTRVNALIRLADLYAFKDFPKSLQYSTNAMELAEKIKNHKQRQRAAQKLAINYYYKGDYTNALKYESIGLQAAISSKDSVAIARSHNNIGNYYYELGEYDEAYYFLTFAFKVLKKASRNNADSVTANISLHNLGRVFKELGQYEIALKHLRASRSTSKAIRDKEGEPYSLEEIGDVKLRMGEYDSALYYLNLSVTEANKLLQDNGSITLREDQSRIFSKIAKAYLGKKNFSNALAYYDSTFNLHALAANKFGIAEAELGRATVYQQQGKTDEAMAYTTKALGIAKEIKARVIEVSCYKLLTTLWEKKGDDKKALGYFKQFHALEDSLYSNEIQQKILRDQIGFETETLDDRIAVLTLREDERISRLKKSEFISNILVVVVALSAILLITVYRSGQRRKQINLLLLQHQEEMQKRSEELEQLNEVKDKFFSIISHDLRSPINALAGLMDLLDKGAIAPHELPVAIKELRTRFNHTRSLMNNLLDWTVLQMDKMHLQAGNVPLKKIVDENIELLGSIQSKHVNMINRIPETAIGYADSNTINLVIRNLITNAIKFTNDGGEIVLASEEKGNELVVSVKDNGIGMTDDITKKLFDKVNPYSTRGTANEKGTGLGLILCKEFVEKNGGRIWVESTVDKGSTFWFTLPKA